MSPPDALIQRFMNRLDHIEYTLHERSRSDIDELRGMIEHMRTARLLEQEDSLRADQLAAAPRPNFAQAAPVMASHRGPGTEAPTPQVDKAIDIARGLLPQLQGARPAPSAPLPAPAVPETAGPITTESQADANASPASGTNASVVLSVVSPPTLSRRAFSNSLVRSREASVNVQPPVTAHLADGAPKYTEANIATPPGIGPPPASPVPATEAQADKGDSPPGGKPASRN